MRRGRRRRGLGRDDGLGETRAEVRDEFDDLLAGFVADAAKVAETGRRGGGEIGDGVDVLAFQNVQGAGGEVQGEDGRFRGGGVERLGAGGGVGRLGLSEAGFREGSVPGVAHFGGGVEALFGLAAQDSGEEAGEGLANVGIEEVGGDGDFVGDKLGSALAVAPARARAGRHLIEDEGGGKALGARVPAVAKGEEGLHVVRGAGADVVEGKTGEGEIEELEVELLGVFANADVVGLEIAMGDAFVLEEFQDVEQVVTEAFEEFAGETAIFGGGEFLFDVVELFEERSGGFGAEERVRVRGVADELGKLGAGAIEDGRQGQPLVVGEELVQLAQVGGGWLIREDQEGERAEREDVADLIPEVAVADGFGGDVNVGGFFEPILDVHGDGGGLRSGPDDAAGLPVEDLELRLRGLCAGDEDGLRAEGAVDDAASMGVAEGVGDLADEIDADVQGEAGAVLLEVVVETDFAGFVAEEDGWAEFVLGKGLSFEDVVMAEAAEDVVLAFGHLVDDAGIDGGLAGDDVDADAAGIVLERDVLGVPVLEPVVGAFGQEFLQLVVGDAAMALGGADAGFMEGFCETMDCGAIEERHVLLEAGGVAELEGGDDAGSVVAVALADADAVGVGEQVLQLWVGEEDEGLDEGEAVDAAGGLAFEEGFELLALAVGVEERVIDGLLAAVGLVVGPGAAVTTELALIALDFDEKEAARGGDEGVYFVDGAIVGDEGEVGPSVLGIAVGKRGAEVFEGLSFPGEGGFGDALPALWGKWHWFG